MGKMLGLLKSHIFSFFLTGVILSILSGCAIPSVKLRTEHAQQLAKAAHWSEFRITTELFDLAGFSSGQQPQPLLTVYFEGDGLAWLSRTRVSPDPTPVRPLGLQLALRHPKAAAIYLARPCQFSQTRNCSQRYWTSARFAPEIISAYSEALDQLKQQFSNDHFQLIGYSGGGAIAALLAAQRTDVVRLVTVAGNLDHAAWTDLHKISPLKDSLNPADFSQQLQHIRQYHFVGGQDRIVPAAVVNSYAEHFPSTADLQVEILAEAEHQSFWVEQWPELYLRIPDK